jgi:septal ring factor EnvC (AmiA/AmiB activator)
MVPKTRLWSIVGGRALLGAALALGTVAPALPQAETKAAREQELETVRAEQKKAADLAAKLKAEVEAIGEDRRKLNQALVGTATRIRSVEERIGATETRIATLDANAAKVRGSLKSRRAVIAEVLAALQRIGHRPPPAIMVRPEDALASVRSAILLGAVLPEMRLEVDALAADLGELVRVSKEMVIERDVLGRDLAALSEEKSRMTLLVQERQKRQTEAETALESERQRAVQLARQADNLKDLIAKLEAAAQARNTIATLRDPGRLTPAKSFVDSRGTLRLPVNGVKIRQFGEPDRLGSTEKGLSIAARPGAQVTAPVDGSVVYAGPFRSYGQLLILDTGGGYHVILAGMERISVDPGQFVVTGEPVAVMGGGPQTAAAVATGSSQPVLYVEFRKDGVPVDPSPWWASTDNEKVRG